MSSQSEGKGILGGCSLGGACNHIKAIGPAPFPYQINLKSVLKAYWLQNAGENKMLAITSFLGPPSAPSYSMLYTLHVAIMANTEKLRMRLMHA